MVKSETRRDAEILVRNPSPRLFGEKFRDSKKVKTNHEKTRLRDLSKTLPRFRDPAKIFRDPRFSRYHSPPLIEIYQKAGFTFFRSKKIFTRTVDTVVTLSCDANPGQFLERQTFCLPLKSISF